VSYPMFVQPITRVGAQPGQRDGVRWR
jgi:hypothetical protein